MAEKRVEVFYQAKGEETWRRVESGVETPPSARQAARALLEEGEVAAARAIAAKRSPTKEASEKEKLKRKLTPEEIFERDMARAMGAWGRYVEIEAKRLFGIADPRDKNRDPQG